MKRIPLLIVKLARIAPIPQQIQHYILIPQIARNVHRRVASFVLRVNEVLSLGWVCHLLQEGHNLGQLAKIDKGSKGLCLVVPVEGGLLDADGHVYVNGLCCHKNI